ncbi:hypothetical protein M0657_009865 [Pyricularia oryzae]|nr:hypothetical protein M9X92_009419 [Pyricularia oryzae]KAI7913724.1 hypothetical protein M0657_009865 [Pyricularia oryzae]
MDGLVHEPSSFLPKSPTERPDHYSPGGLDRRRPEQSNLHRLPVCRIAARLCWLVARKIKRPAAMGNPPNKKRPPS